MPSSRRIPARSARTSPSDSASFSPKITVLTASFIAAPVPSGPRWKSAGAVGLEDRPGALEVRQLSADHQRQLPALGQADAAGHRRIEDARAAVTDGRFVAPDDGRRDCRAVDEHAARSGAGDDAIGPGIHGVDRWPRRPASRSSRRWRRRPRRGSRRSGTRALRPARRTGPVSGSRPSGRSRPRGSPGRSRCPCVRYRRSRPWSWRP